MAAKKAKPLKIVLPEDGCYVQPSLFEESLNSDAFPPIDNSVAAIRKMLESDEDIGLDLEYFEDKYEKDVSKRWKPSILGIATEGMCGAVKWDTELAREVVDSVAKKGRKLIGHAVIGADKPVLDEACKVITPLTLWGDSMLTHYVCHLDFCKGSTKEASSDQGDSGSLGFMNLWTAASMVTMLPRWKACRGPLHCEDNHRVCPSKGVFSYCLRGDARVLMPEGTSVRISALHESNYRGKVFCVNPDGELVLRDVKRTFKTLRNNRNLVELTYVDVRETNRRKRRSIVLTEDHQVLTRRGYVAVSELTLDDEIATGHPGMSDRQLGILAGLLLGDSHLKPDGTSGLCIANMLEAQGDYVILKTKCFDNFKYTVGTSKTNSGVLRTVRFKSSPFWRKLIRETSSFVEFAEKHLNEHGLALWYLDDGSHSGRTRGRGWMSIAVSSLSQAECERLIKLLKTRFEVTAVLSEYAKGIGQNYTHKCLRFNVEESLKLSEIIGRYTPPSMRYKLMSGAPEFDESLYYADYQNCWSSVLRKPAKGRVIAGKLIPENYVYCLEVDEFNNFATEGGVVHNCAVDAWAGLQIYKRNLEVMDKFNFPRERLDDMVELAEICHIMETRGLAVDRERVKELAKEMKEHKDAIFAYEMRGGKKEFKKFNPQSPKQTLAWFHENNIFLDSTDKKVVFKELEKIAKKFDLPNADALLSGEVELPLTEGQQELINLFEYKSGGKGVDPWFANKYFGPDGLLHPRTILTGTSSTRFASSKPNIQNVGRRGWAKKIKTCIVPRSPDLDFLESDASQLELRCCLWMAGEDTKVADTIFERVVEKSAGALERAAKYGKMSERDVAKSVSHASAYGESITILTEAELRRESTQKDIAEGALLVHEDWLYADGVVGFTGINIADRMFGDHGRKSRADALALRAIYMDLVPAIGLWQRRVLKFIEENGYVQLPTGHFIPLYDTPRENAKKAIATLGQGTGCQLIQQIMLRFKRERNIIPVMNIHDSLVLEIPKEWSNRKALDLISLMHEETPVLKGLKVPGKPTRGKNYGELEPLCV